MSYNSLTIKQFRSYKNQTFVLSPEVSIIVGPNGSGKTNLLEAIYVLSYGSSFRVSDKDLLQYNQTQFKLEGIYGDQLRILNFDLQAKPIKQFVIDGIKRQRLSPALRVPLVLFEPDELRLLSGSPQRRRDYMDLLTARLWPGASKYKNYYERALIQRNNIIKQAQQHSPKDLEDQLFVWDIKLAEYGAELASKRCELLSLWNEQLSDLYSQVAGIDSQIKVIYKTEIDADNYATAMLKLLTTRRSLDLFKGHTGIGPHRDDFIVLLNGVDAAISASRGEVRTLVLCIKMIELAMMSKISDKKPILLMDDVFSELDIARRQALSQLAQNYQTIITTTDADHITRHFVDQHAIIDITLTNPANCAPE